MYCIYAMRRNGSKTWSANIVKVLDRDVDELLSFKGHVAFNDQSAGKHAGINAPFMLLNIFLHLRQSLCHTGTLSCIEYQDQLKISRKGSPFIFCDHRSPCKAGTSMLHLNRMTICEVCKVVNDINPIPLQAYFTWNYSWHEATPFLCLHLVIRQEVSGLQVWCLLTENYRKYWVKFH